MAVFSKFLTGLAIFASCSQVKPEISALVGKKAPEYQGVAPVLQPYVDDYMALANKRDIKFKRSVTIGFKKLGSPKEEKDAQKSSIVGLCHYRKEWREIDIDSDYWDKATEEQKYVLIFHELTHCYCTRGHDYEEGKEYPDDAISTVIQSILIPIGYKTPGFMADSCPMSIMYPVVIASECFSRHTEEYLKEMLNRCDPW